MDGKLLVSRRQWRHAGRALHVLFRAVSSLDGVPVFGAVDGIGLSVNSDRSGFSRIPRWRMQQGGDGM